MPDECGETATRVPEVIDTWYDSGAMPFAQWGYQPELGRGVEAFEARLPRRLHLRGDRPDARVVLHADGRGRAAFRRDGLPQRRVPRPPDRRRRPEDVEVARQHVRPVGGARPPGRRRPALVHAHERLAVGVAPDRPRGAGRASCASSCCTLWNVYAFFVTYANAEGFDPAAERRRRAERPAARPVGAVAARAARCATCARRAGGLRRHRRRPRDPGVRRRPVELVRAPFPPAVLEPGRRGDADDARAAFHTLHECLVTVAQLLAPFTPFVSRGAVAQPRGGARRSAGLRAPGRLPAPPTRRRSTPDLDEAMAAARAIVELGRRVRVETKVRIAPAARRGGRARPRRPRARSRPLLPIVAEELNVKTVAFAESADAFGTWRAKPNFKVLGPRLGPRVKEVAAALAADDGTLAERLAAGARRRGHHRRRPRRLDRARGRRARPGGARGLGGRVRRRPHGRARARVSPELRREGVARELVRIVQDAREGGRPRGERPHRAGRRGRRRARRGAGRPRRGHRRRDAGHASWLPGRSRTRRTRRPPSWTAIGTVGDPPRPRGRRSSPLRPRRAARATGSPSPSRRPAAACCGSSTRTGSSRGRRPAPERSAPARLSLRHGPLRARRPARGGRGCAAGSAAAAGAADRAFLAMAFTASACPWTSVARLCRKSAFPGEEGVDRRRSAPLPATTVAPPASAAACSLASATIRAASSRARWMISSAWRLTSSRSDVPTIGAPPARIRSFSAMSASVEAVSRRGTRRRRASL